MQPLHLERLETDHRVKADAHPVAKIAPLGVETAAYPADVDAKKRFLGDQRLNAWYPFNSLEKISVTNAFGSDFPASGAISTYKMLEQIQYAMTRKFLSGKGDIWPPEEERITLEAAIEAATINGAYTIALEDEIGSIEVGKKADLIVLDGNPLEDITLFENGFERVLLVMKEGMIMKDRIG